MISQLCSFRQGCGNNIHIKCMKVWAEHQKSQGAQLIKCPMCREDFGPFSLLQQVRIVHFFYNVMIDQGWKLTFFAGGPTDHQVIYMCNLVVRRKI